MINFLFNFVVLIQSDPNLERFFQWAGGRERLDSFVSLTLEFESEYFEKVYSRDTTEYKSKTFISKKTVTYDGKFRQESFLPSGMKREVAYDGQRFVEVLQNGYSPPVSETIIENYKKRVIHLGEIWMAYRASKIKFLGKEDRFYVYSMLYNDVERKYFLDDDFRLVKVSLFDDMSEIYFEDYRDINGIKVPFKIIGYVNKTKEFISVIKEATVNQSIPDEYFKLN